MHSKRMHVLSEAPHYDYKQAWDLGMGDDIMAIATGFGFGDGGMYVGWPSWACVARERGIWRVIPWRSQSYECTS